jgi:hypothetical protein
MKPLRGVAVFVAALLIVASCHLFTPETSQWRIGKLFEGTLLEATYTPTPIQSLQPFTATFAGGSPTTTVTITALRATSNAIIIPNGLLSTTAGGLYAGSGFLRAAITSTTLVTVTAGVAPLAGAYYRGVVVEFMPNFVKTGSCGNAVFPNSATDTQPATISPTVVPAKTLLVRTGQSMTSTLTLNGSAETEKHFQSDIVLTNGTTATATWTWNGVNSKPQDRIVGFCYVEFK